MLIDLFQSLITRKFTNFYTDGRQIQCSYMHKLGIFCFFVLESEKSPFGPRAFTGLCGPKKKPGPLTALVFTQTLNICYENIFKFFESDVLRVPKIVLY